MAVFAFVEPSDWVSLLSDDDGLRLRPGASEVDIGACEAALAYPFPDELRSLYLASDGVWDEPGQWFVIWPLANVAEENRRASHVEGSSRHQWIGFGDDGTGNPFCLRRQGDGEVYYWSSIDRSATRLAGSLMDFWRVWAAGSLPPH